MQQHFEIIGTGGYLPERIISSQELDERLGLDPGWTERHTGVTFRHQRAPHETGTTMGRCAALAALDDANRSLNEIDLIVDASTCQQKPIPCNAALLNEALGDHARGIASLDVHASCLSFLTALSAVNGFFAAGQFQRALIVSSETPLDGVNWRDPASACLMGDGAAAAVVQRRQPTAPLAYRHETWGEFSEVCQVAAGGHRIAPFHYTAESADRYRFFMDGPALHRIASRKLPPLLEAVLSQTGDSLERVHVIPHQASGPALRLLGRRLSLPPERLHTSLSDHGNLVAAGIPFSLHRAQSKIARGERVLLLGTAAGYAQAAMIFTW